jgi:flagellar motor protein MotB
MKQGANPKLVVAKGLGDLDPVGPNNTRQGRAKHRRVEFSLAPAIR